MLAAFRRFLLCLTFTALEALALGRCAISPDPFKELEPPVVTEVSKTRISAGPAGFELTFVNRTSAPVEALVLIARHTDSSGRQVRESRTMYDVVTGRPFSKPIPPGKSEIFHIKGLGHPYRYPGQAVLAAVVLADGRTFESPYAIDWILNQRRLYRDSYGEILRVLESSEADFSWFRSRLITELETARDRKIEAEADPCTEEYIREVFDDCISRLKAGFKEDVYRQAIDDLRKRYAERKARLNVVVHP